MNGLARARSDSARGASVPSCHSRIPTANRPSARRSSAPASTNSRARRRAVAWGSPVSRNKSRPGSGCCARAGRRRAVQGGVTPRSFPVRWCVARCLSPFLWISASAEFSRECSLNGHGGITHGLSSEHVEWRPGRRPVEEGRQVAASMAGTPEIAIIGGGIGGAAAAAFCPGRFPARLTSSIRYHGDRRRAGRGAECRAIASAGSAYSIPRWPRGPARCRLGVSALG